MLIWMRRRWYTITPSNSRKHRTDTTSGIRRAIRIFSQLDCSEFSHSTIKLNTRWSVSNAWISLNILYRWWAVFSWNTKMWNWLIIGIVYLQQTLRSLKSLSVENDYYCARLLFRTFFLYRSNVQKYCIELYCTVPHCSSPYRTVPHRTAPYRAVPCCTDVHTGFTVCTHCTVFHWYILGSVVTHTVLYCISTCNCVIIIIETSGTKFIINADEEYYLEVLSSS